MFPFDVIDSAGHGYRKVWDERRYLAKIALIPVLIKIACYVIIIAVDWGDNYFRRALVMLPSYFADGWMITHFIRLIFLGQRWPFRPTGELDNDLAVLESRARSVMAGTLAFVVINFLMAGLMAVMFEVNMSDAPHDSTPDTPGDVSQPVLYLMLLAFIGFMIWVFRFIWLFIPAALSYPIRAFYKEIGGFMTSLSMVSTWIIGYMPLFFIFTMISSALLEPYGNDPASAPATIEFMIGALNVMTDTVVSLVTTGGIAYGLKELLNKNTKKPQRKL